MEGHKINIPDYGAQLAKETNKLLKGNKMENKDYLEKKQFFAAYWGVKDIWQHPDTEYSLEQKGKFDACVWEGINIDSLDSEDYLLLRDLKEITDEDAEEIDFDDREELLMCLFGQYMETTVQDELYGWQTDILRAKGYLLPWRNYTTKDLVDKGWVKINSNE